MKKVIFSLLLVVFVLSQSEAQLKPITISFEEFGSWMKTLTPMGYPFTETGKNGEEYLATFLKAKELKMIGITLSPLSSFDDYKKFKGVSPYDLKGHRAAFYGTQGFWNLSVELLNLNAVMQVTSVYIEVKQEDLEKIVMESGAFDKK